MDCQECHLVFVIVLPKQKRLAVVGPLSDVVTCVKKLNSQVSTYSVIYYSQ